MSYDKWCRSFCRRHCEKSLSLVCSLVMEVEREERQSLMAETREEKNSVANVGEPVGNDFAGASEILLGACTAQA